MSTGANKEIKFTFGIDQNSVNTTSRALRDLISLAERAVKALNQVGGGGSGGMSVGKAQSSFNVSNQASKNVFSTTGSNVNKSLSSVFLDNAKSLESLAKTGGASMKTLTESLKRAVTEQKQVLSQLDSKISETESRLKKLQDVRSKGGPLSKFVTDSDISSAQSDFVNYASQRAKASEDLNRLQALGSGSGGSGLMPFLQSMAMRAGVPPQLVSMLNGGTAGAMAFGAAGIGAGATALQGFHSLATQYGSGQYGLQSGAIRGNYVNQLFGEAASGQLGLAMARGRLNQMDPRYRYAVSADKESNLTGSAWIDSALNTKMGMLFNYGGTIGEFSKKSEDGRLTGNFLERAMQFMSQKEQASDFQKEAVGKFGVGARRDDIVPMDAENLDQRAQTLAMNDPLRYRATSKFESSMGRAIHYSRMGYGGLSRIGPDGKKRIASFYDAEADLTARGFSPEERVAGGSALQGMGGYYFGHKNADVAMQAMSTGFGSFIAPFAMQAQLGIKNFAETGYGPGKGKYGQIDPEAGLGLSTALLQMATAGHHGDFDPTALQNQIRTGMGFTAGAEDMLKTRRAIEGMNLMGAYTTGAASPQQKGINALIANQIGNKNNLGVYARSALENMTFAEVMAGANGGLGKQLKGLGIDASMMQDYQDKFLNAYTGALIPGGSKSADIAKRKMAEAGGGVAGLKALNSDELDALASAISADQGTSYESVLAGLKTVTGDPNAKIKGRKPGSSVKGSAEGDSLQNQADAMKQVNEAMLNILQEIKATFATQNVGITKMSSAVQEINTNVGVIVDVRNKHSAPIGNQSGVSGPSAPDDITQSGAIKNVPKFTP